MKKKVFVYSIAGLLLGIHAIITGLYIRYTAPTEDEPVYIVTGYLQIKQNYFGLETRNPPLVRTLQTLPLLFLNLIVPPPENEPEWRNKYILGERFLYHNSVPAETIVTYARIPTLILSLLLGYFIFRWSRDFYGDYIGLIILYFYTFSPNILAHAGLATNDLPVTLFIFLTFYFYRRCNLNPTGWINWILFGLCIGAALCTKFTSLVIIPVLILVSLCWRNGKIYTLPRILITLTGIILTILVTYHFTYPHYFFSGMLTTLRDLKIGHDNFFIGQHSRNGWRHFYLISTLICTPIPILILLILSIITYLIKSPLIPLFPRGTVNTQKVNNSFKETVLLYLPVIILFIVASLSNKQSHRYILPVYPFIFVVIGGILKFIGDSIPIDRREQKTGKDSGKKPLLKLRNYTFLTDVRIFWVILLVWYLSSSLRIFPYYLDYYNEFIIGPKHGYKYFISDWGQDLYRLKQYLDKEKPDSLILGFYGGGQPEHLNIKFQNLWTDTCTYFPLQVNPSEGIKKELLILSHDYLCGQHFEKEKQVFHWLETENRPITRIGYNLFVYDVTYNAKVHVHLANLYFLDANLPATRREINRTLVLEPDNLPVRLISTLTYLRNQQPQEAISEYKSIRNKTPDLPIPDIQYIGTAKEVYAQALLPLASMLSDRGMYDDSLWVYRKIISLQPDNVGGYFGVGTVYHRTGKIQLAIEYYQRALTYDTQNPGIHFNLGLIYFQRQEWNKAQTEFQQVLTLQPGNESVKSYLRIITTRM